MRAPVLGGLLGVVFGLVLVWSGMSDPDVIRGALLFEDAYLYLMFASAVGTAAIGLRVLRRVRPSTAWEPERLQRRHVTGAAVFGLGWGVSAACPAPVATQVGQGIPWALATMTGVLIGVALHLRRGSAETEPARDTADARVWRGAPPGELVPRRRYRRGISGS